MSESGETILERVEQFVADHLPLITLIFALFVLAGGGYGAWTYWRSSQEESAREALYVAEAKLKNKLKSETENWEKARSASKETSVNPRPSREAIVLAMEKKDVDELVSGLKSVIEDYPSTRVADEAAVVAVKILLAHKRLDEANQILEPRALKKKENLLGGLVRFQYATLKFLKGDYKEAKAWFEEITNDKNLIFLHADALLRLGQIAEKDKSLDQAKMFYDKLIRDHGQTQAAKNARESLRWLNYSKALSKGS